MLPTRVLLIDDHALFRSGLSMVLRSGIADVQIVEAASLEQVMRDSIEAPAVVLLDIQLLGLNGLEGINLLKRKWPHVPIIMLSSDATPKTVKLALERGASAFVSKADTADNILALIGHVLRGQPMASPHLSAELQGGQNMAQPRLTPRQCEVLDLLCQGLANKVIARRLDVSENTVRGHVQAILAFMQVSSRSEAVFEARHRGLVS
jgi:DNA-binding NarL/FixJ family response regulator